MPKTPDKAPEPESAPEAVTEPVLTKDGFIVPAEHRETLTETAEAAPEEAAEPVLTKDGIIVPAEHANTRTVAAETALGFVADPEPTPAPVATCPRCGRALTLLGDGTGTCGACGGIRYDLATLPSVRGW
jgi:hypothetical protein